MFYELSALEIISTMSLALYVILAARENPWCWPVSIVGVVTYMVVTFEKQIYLEVGLNFYYLVVSAFGMWYWMRGGPAHRHLVITRTPVREWMFLGTFVVIATIALALFIDHVPERLGLFPTDVAWLDSITTVLSLAATYLLFRKRLENWFVWIVADIIYVPLMIYKEAYGFAGLYGFYLIACVYGIATWSTHMRRHTA